ncbi:MAG: thiol-disulfide isomerase/thioredoxin [Myxococcota bacterium]|jgi:thiol-disulfide isomerase/thioredoxin
MVSAPASNEPIAAVIQREMSTAARDGKTVIVTVGAEWCEPCQRFHEAVEAGALDEAFPNARFVEFDLDRDLDRLKAAGYSSLMIPLFSIPGADGRDQGRRHMGAVKGAGAVDFIVTRLKALLAQ